MVSTLARALLRFLKHNLGMKAIALCLAVLSWHAIHGAINHETVITRVPLSMQTDEDWVIVDRSSDSADVVARGARGDLLQLSRDRLRIDVTVPVPERGRQVIVPLRPTDVTGPSGLRIMAVRPDSVELSLDRWETRPVPVTADLALATLPDHLAIERVVCEPAAVEVTGGRSVLDRLQTVGTERLDLSRRRQTFEEYVMLSIPAGIEKEHISPRRVLLRVDLVERDDRRTIDEAPVRVLIPPGLSADIQVRPTLVRVELRGSGAALPAVLPEQVIVYVDATGLEAGGRYELPLRARVPEGVVVESLHPQSAVVLVAPR